VGVLIGITGQARAGKDTTAEYLAKKYGFVRVGLADPMKRFCAEVFDFSDEQLYGDKRDEPDLRYQKDYVAIKADGTRERRYLTPRYALQTLGTEWGRDCYSNIWIEYGVRVAETILEGRHSYSVKSGLILHSDWEPCPGVVFSDLRFRNEFDAVCKAGGTMMRIKRPGYDGNVGAENHASEAEQKSLSDSAFDFVLDNSDSFEHLYKQIDAIMDSRVK
jgi:hypothetical protein